MAAPKFDINQRLVLVFRIYEKYEIHTLFKYYHKIKNDIILDQTAPCQVDNEIIKY